VARDTKTSRMMAGCYGAAVADRAGATRNTVHGKWRPKECKFCFHEVVVFWKTKAGFQCYCPECKKAFNEIFSSEWRNR
jgi:hypothetical protein